MSVKSWLIDTRQSMIVVDPKEFPIGLGQTTREDYPTESAGVLLYEGKNILPTPFGYQSFFDQSATFNIGNLAGKLIQKTFVYQSAQLSQVLVALCEDGIYVANGTTVESSPWSRIVDLSAGLVAGVRRLWTTAVIGNRVFCYMQGQSKIWAFVTPDVYTEAASPSPISDATRAQVWTAWGAGLVSYIPNFINMAGQIGIFRADNRLGMWDSANAVAWSSANYIEDFKPSAQTFAGVTTFTDVQGRITLVMGHGDGFIIYATNSIVLATSLSGTPEKWKGTAITSDIGVAFDTQIVASQPDTTHFALTMAGLLIIKEGQSQYVITEVIDFLALHNKLLSLTMIEGRYLFIHWNENFPGSRYGVEAVDNSDFNDNIYKFPRPVGGSPEDGFKNLLDTYVNGSNEALQEAFKDYEPLDAPPVFPPDEQLLEPCYNIKTFESTWADTTFTPNPTASELLDSKIQIGVTYLLENYIIAPTVTVNSISEDTNAPGDWAGQEIIDKLDQGIIKFNAQVAYQNAWSSANGSDIPVNLTRTGPVPLQWDGINPLVVNWEDTFIDKYFLPNCLSVEDFKATANECRIRLYADKDRLLEIEARFTGVETYTAGNLWGFWNSFATTNNSNTSLPLVTAPKFAVRVPYTADLEAQFLTEWQNTYGEAFNQQVKIQYEAFSPYFYCNPRYCTWAALKFPDQCIVEGGSRGQFFGALGLSLSAFPVGGIYSYYATANFPIFDERLMWEIAAGATWNFDPGYPYRFSIPSGATSNDPYGWGPYPNNTTGGPKYFSTQILQTGEQWNGSEQLARMSQAGADGDGYYTLVGTITKTVELKPNFSANFTIYEAELSGWGYTPRGGFSFRKTHKRHSSTTCPMATSTFNYVPGNSKPPEIGNKATDAGGLNPPYKWEYPDSLPFGPNTVLYQKGSLAAYYPLYKGAIVYDSLLEKFGSYDSPHYMVFGTMPVNRADLTIVPLPDVGMFAGAISETKEAKMFNANTPEALAVWGKIGYYRQGMTAMQEIRAYFKEKAYGSLIVEVSMDGVAVDPTLTLAVNFNGESSAILPFTAVGKWFNIRIEGRFNLTTLQINSESAGRR